MHNLVDNTRVSASLVLHDVREYAVCSMHTLVVCIIYNNILASIMYVYKLVLASILAAELATPPPSSIFAIPYQGSS